MPDNNPKDSDIISADHALADLAAEVARNVRASRAPNTLKAYEGDWNRFALWCDQRDLVALPTAAPVVARVV